MTKEIYDQVFKYQSHSVGRSHMADARRYV